MPTEPGALTKWVCVTSSCHVVCAFPFIVWAYFHIFRISPPPLSLIGTQHPTHGRGMAVCQPPSFGQQGQSQRTSFWETAKWLPVSVTG